MATKKKAVPTRAEEFFKTGATLAAKIGIENVTRRAIAEAHNVSDPLVGKHVGGKAELQAGIKKTLKRLGLKEPTADVIAKKGEELRSRGTKKPAKKVVAKKSVASKAGKKSSAPSRAVAKSKPAKKSVAPAKKRASSAPVKSPAVPAKPADPKKGAPSRKVVKKAPSNKAKFPPKLPPLPALPTI